MHDKFKKKLNSMIVEMQRSIPELNGCKCSKFHVKPGQFNKFECFFYNIAGNLYHSFSWDMREKDQPTIDGFASRIQTKIGFN